MPPTTRRRWLTILGMDRSLFGTSASVRLASVLGVILAVIVLLNLSAASARAAPSNDNFEAILLYFDLPFTTTQTTVGATLQPGEPRPCGSIGATVWVVFVSPLTGRVNLTTAGSGFDTVLAVYTGDSLPALALIGCDDDSGPGNSSNIPSMPSKERHIESKSGATLQPVVSWFFRQRQIRFRPCGWSTSFRRARK